MNNNGRTKVAVFVDLANINGAFDAIKKQSGLSFSIKMDYTKFVSAITLGSEIVSKSVYVGTIKSAEENGQRKFLEYFRLKGFYVRTKEVKVITHLDGTKTNKANFDVELTVDVCRHIWRRECNEIIIVSGDSDFAYLVDEAKEIDISVTIVSSQGTLSRELRERADRLILLEDLPIDQYTFNKDYT